MSRQKLGQHFLSQASWRTRIAETLPVERDAIWLEIGAGHGEMTEFLATRARRVIAIETDAALASALRKRAGHSPATANLSVNMGSSAKAVEFPATSGWPNVEVVHTDILSLDLADLVRRFATNDSRQGTVFYTDAGSATVPKDAPMREALGPEARLKAGKPVNASASHDRFRVYGNLPYYITSPILSHLFRFADLIDSIHIVTQLEVAQRIAAQPRSRDYGYLSTLCQFYARPELVFRIPPGAFQPPPKVTSALIEMHLPGERATLGIRDEHAFLKFLQTCFAHKRKTLRNNLRATRAHDAVAKALAAAALTENSRAEELTLQQFAQLFLSLAA
ncbi:MAG TPA: rRNA adenine dimethyltransferase family protein [Candidatus Acidoferrales bacterium]|nr:rRNA adenine dimethyltransferase family protein [Candidatus Acidoferrales bacterium]